MVSMDPANEVLLATTQRRWTAFGAWVLSRIDIFSSHPCESDTSPGLCLDEDEDEMKIMLVNNAGRTQTIYTFHSEEGRVQALQTYFGIRLIREAGVIHE